MKQLVFCFDSSYCSSCTAWQVAFNADSPLGLIRSALQWIAFGAILLLGLQLVIVSLWLNRLAGAHGAAARAAARVTQEHRLIFRFRLALATVGMVVTGNLLPGWRPDAVTKIAAILAFVTIIGSEVLGRTLFYEPRVWHGV
jgi:DMSO reductase anchor subunit